MEKIKLSIIIPCYNEERRFRNEIGHFTSYLKNVKFSWEMILVNDGSKDKTLGLMKNLAKNIKNIKILSYQQNRGKGYALAQGVKKSSGKFVLFSDIDHSVSVETVEEFFKQFANGSDIVIASRRMKGSSIEKSQPPIRVFLGKGFSFLVRILIDPKIMDTTCGFKAFKSEVAKNLFNKLTISDWSFDAEIIFLARKYKYTVAQVPVRWKNDPESKVSLKRDVINSLIGLLKIRTHDLLGKY